MPPLRPTSRTAVSTRAQYVRSTGDLLYNDPEGWLSDGQHGPVWWVGLDSGGGQYPIGPNGPNAVEGIPAIIRATALITGPLTAAPFRVLEGGFGGKPLGRPRWITDPQLLRADDRYPGLEGVGSVLAATRQLARGEFWTVWLRSAIWWGMGPLLFVPDATGQPTPGTMVVVNPRTLGTRYVDGSLRWVIAADPDDGFQAEEVVFDRDGHVSIGGIEWRLMVLRNPHSPVGEDGLSRGVFELCPSAFRFAGQVDSYASSTFRSGVPAGYLKVETPGLQQPQADELKRRWMAAHGGDRRSIAVLNSTTSFNPISLSPIDAALGETKRLSIADVAFAFGLDPITLGVSLANSATYNNVQEAWRNHRDFGLTLWISGVQDTLSALLPGTQGVVVDLDAFAQPSPTERYAAYAAAITAGILTIDEVRDMEGMPPLPAAPPDPVPQPPPELEDDPDPVPAVRRLRPQPAPWKVTSS